jgi:hypothetical protein
MRSIASALSQPRTIGMAAAVAAGVGLLAGLFVAHDALGYESDRRVAGKMNQMIVEARKAYAISGRVPETVTDVGSDGVRYKRLSDHAIELCGQFNWAGAPKTDWWPLRTPDVITCGDPADALRHPVSYMARDRGLNCFTIDVRPEEETLDGDGNVLWSIC